MALGLTQFSNRNEYQEYFLGVKATVLKSRSLSLLEPSGPVQACNGIAFLRLPFYSFGRSEELAEGRGWEFAQRVRFLM